MLCRQSTPMRTVVGERNERPQRMPTKEQILSVTVTVPKVGGSVGGNL